MKKMNNKGFTIVELVIVIAVIAILAAVLIPTFSGVIQKANESSSLQTATSAMKTVLAQSSSATIADGTYFCIGSDKGVEYIYQYNNSKMGTENKVSTKKLLLGDSASINGNSNPLNTLIVPAQDKVPSTSAKTVAIIKEILGDKTDKSVVVAAQSPKTDDDTTAAENAGYVIYVYTKLGTAPSDWNDSTNPSAGNYYKLDNSNAWVAATTTDTATNCYSRTTISVLTNTDFAEGTVVFTYSK